MQICWYVRKDKKATEEKLNTENLIIKEYGLKTNMEKDTDYRDFEEPRHKCQNKS